MMVRTQFFTFMVHSTMAESVGKTVGLSVIPFDIHIMHKKVRRRKREKVLLPIPTACGSPYLSLHRF